MAEEGWEARWERHRVAMVPLRSRCGRRQAALGLLLSAKINDQIR